MRYNTEALTFMQSIEKLIAALKDRNFTHWAQKPIKKIYIQILKGRNANTTLKEKNKA